MKKIIRNSLFVVFSLIIFFFGYSFADAQYYDSGALMYVPEGSGLTAIGYGSDDKACTLSIQYAPVNPDGTINFNNIGSTSVNCTNGPGNDPANPGAPYQTGRYAVGWTWGTRSGSPSSGGRYSGSPYDDDFPEKMCYYQEYASLIDIGNGNTANYKGWGQPYTGSCRLDGYDQFSWLKRVLYAPAGTVIVSIGMSLANDGDVGTVTMVTRAGPVAPENITVSLSASPTSMTLPTNSSTLTWSTTGSPTSCTASGSWSGSKSASGGSEARTGLSVGSYTYTITCSKSGVPDATASVTVNVADQICTVTNFSANPNPIVTSGSTGVTTINANVNCNYDIRIGSPSGSLFASGLAGSANHTTGNWVTNGMTFYLQKSGNTTAGGTMSTLTVNLSAPASIGVNLTASPTSMTWPSNSTTLSWTTTGSPDSCNATGSWTGGKNVSGGTQGVSVGSSGTYSYTITCSKSGLADVSSTATITVNGVSPITVNLNASPTTMTSPSNQTYLSWLTTGSPTSCTATGSWSGSKTPTSSGGEWRTGLGIGTYTYNLTCSKSGTSDVSDSVAVTVNPSACNYNVTSIQGYNSSTGVYTSDVHMNDVLILNGTFGTQAEVDAADVTYQPSGFSANSIVTLRTPTQIRIYPLSGTGTFTFQIRKDANCATTASVPVISSPTIGVTLTASPSSIYTGNSTRLTWSTTGNPTSCVGESSAYGWTTGSKSVSGGYQDVSPTGNWTFRIRCSRTDASPQSVTSSASVTVSAAPGGSCTPSTVGTNQMYGCVYTGTSFNTLASMNPITGPVIASPAPNTATPLPNVNWGLTGPGTLTDSYSVRWKGRFNFSGGTYVFTTASDDGSRAYFDDNNDGVPDGGYLVNDWSLHPIRNTSGLPVIVPAGQRTLVYEMYEYTGGAGYGLSWQKQGTTPTVTINANPTSGNSPLDTDITWSTTGSPTSCTASGGWSGSKAVSGGTQPITGITSNTTYTLTCSNTDGGDSDSVTVTVNTQHSLEVFKTYGGSVRSSDTLIDCGADCNRNYASGTAVTLTPYPDSSAWRFVGWQGDCAGTGSCNLTIDGPKTVTAIFALKPLIYREF